MKRLNRPLTGAFCILAGILSAMSFTVGQTGYAGISDLPASPTSYLWTALALCFAWLYHHVFVKRQMELRALPVLFALLFGVCNSFGSVLFVFPVQALLAFTVFLILVGVTHYVSVGSVAAAIVLPLLEVFTRFSDPTLWIITCCIGASVVWRHRANIQRLMNHTESKLDFSKLKGRSKK